MKYVSEAEAQRRATEIINRCQTVGQILVKKPLKQKKGASK